MFRLEAEGREAEGREAEDRRPKAEGRRNQYQILAPYALSLAP
jgi:hypothetical protein